MKGVASIRHGRMFAWARTLHGKLSLFLVSALRERLHPCLYSVLRWAYANTEGLTVAHIAAQYCVLPADFEGWDMINEGGWTVAHVAAESGHLPEDFSQWGLAGKDGYTVAHSAASYGHLPADFDQWDLTATGNWPVWHAAAHAYALQCGLRVGPSWDAPDGSGLTVARVAMNRGHLTEEQYMKWRVNLEFDSVPCSEDAILL
jgi:hypothetical protein